MYEIVQFAFDFLGEGWQTAKYRPIDKCGEYVSVGDSHFNVY